jgi:hypothetical protein
MHALLRRGAEPSVVDISSIARFVPPNISQIDPALSDMSGRPEPHAVRAWWSRLFSGTIRAPNARPEGSRMVIAREFGHHPAPMIHLEIAAFTLRETAS